MFFERPSDLPHNDPLALLHADSIGLVQPVSIGESLVGTLAVGGKPGSNRFTAARLSVIQTFGDFLGIQIVNARFQEERVQNLLVAQEIGIATQIQRSLLPTTLPQPPGFALAATCENAKEVGGDFYDVIGLGRERWLIILGDVMGKGLPSAMFAMILRSLTRASADQDPAPGRLLGRINGLLYEELSKVEMFITAQVALLDAAAREVTLANAGHCPALLSGPGGRVDAFSPEGMPLGVLPDTLFEETRIQIRGGECLMMYTDGVTETVCTGGGMFGQKRLMEWLARSVAAGQHPETMREMLLRALAGFQGDSTLRDDQTFVILSRAGGREKSR
jgi:sigma-B regulation protein RsbU (phosphoserine phosphatase)